jgi:hypothetical protein
VKMVGTTRSLVSSFMNQEIGLHQVHDGIKINTSDQQVAAAKQWFACPGFAGMVRL